MTEHVFMNDQPYKSSEDDPLKALGDTLAFSVNDWGASRAMSWVWGIVCGWDDEAMAEQAAKHGWSVEAVARLKRLHERFEQLSLDGVRTLEGSVNVECTGGMSDIGLCPWCRREGSHAPDCEGLRRFLAGEEAPVAPPSVSPGSDDGYNFTLTLDCGCSVRLNMQPGIQVPLRGWFYRCPTGQHSEIREYDPQTGDPIYQRDRQVVSTHFDGDG